MYPEVSLKHKEPP